jgi:hypothetical protein
MEMPSFIRRSCMRVVYLLKMGTCSYLGNMTDFPAVSTYFRERLLTMNAGLLLYFLIFRERTVEWQTENRPEYVFPGGYCTVLSAGIYLLLRMSSVMSV